MRHVGYCLFKSNVYKMLPSSYIDMTIFSNLSDWFFFINTTLRLGSLWGAKTGLTAGTSILLLNVRGGLPFASWESGKFFFFFFLQRCTAECEVMKGVRLQVDGFVVLVDPGHWNPLGCGANQVYGFLQELNSLVNLIIDDGLVKIMCICLLEDLGLLLQPL